MAPLALPDEVRISLYKKTGRPQAATAPARALVIVAHSAAGKSALLEQIGADRRDRDMDVFCYIHQMPPSVDAMLTMADRLSRLPVIVCSNEDQFLADLHANLGNPRLADFLFCYIRRPQSVLYDNLGLINTDGRRRSYVSEADHERSYRAFDARYRELADIEVEYFGASVPSMSAIVQSLLGRLTR